MEVPLKIINETKAYFLKQIAEAKTEKEKEFFKYQLSKLTK
jgi:hypothetical protein